MHIRTISLFTSTHTTTYCKAAVLDLSSSQKQMSEKTTKSSNSQKRRHQVAHSVPCQLEYSGECLSPFTYKCHLPSSQGLGKVLLSPPWCAWQTFLPRLGDKLVMHSEKVRGNSMHSASGAFSVFFLFYASLVRCNLCMQSGVHRLCFRLTERWSSVLFEKAARVVITEEAFWLGFFSMEGFCCGGEIINTKFSISASQTVNRTVKKNVKNT